MISMISLSFLYATPLIIAALGGLYCEKSGVTNIALEGIMLVGAFVAAVITYELGLIFDFNSFMGKAIPFIAVIVAGIIGGVFSLIHAVASIRYRADQIISGTGLNMLATGLTVFLAQIMYHQQRTPTYKQGFTRLSTEWLGEVPGLKQLGQVPVFKQVFNFIGDIFSQTYPPFILALILVVVTALIVKKTRFGLRLKACGEYPQAAASMGVNVIKIRYIGVIISGILAGIAGATMILTVDTQFSFTVIHGFGFIALATLIFGKWNAWGVLFSGIFFGVSTMLSISSKNFDFLQNIPNELFFMLPYVLTIIALVVTSSKSAGPKAIGEIYDPGKR